MFWSPKTPCVHPTRHHSGSHLMVPLICLTHQQSKVWCVVPWDPPSLDPPLPNRTTEWDWSERPMLGVFLFRHNPVEILPKNRAFQTPQFITKQAKFWTPNSYTLAFVLQIWEGGWANEGGPAAKTQQKESLLTVYQAKTGCGACHCTYQVDPAIFNALEAKYKCKLKLQVNIFQFSSLPTNMSSCLTLTGL